MESQSAWTGQELNSLLAHCQLAGCVYVLRLPIPKLEELYSLTFEELVKRLPAMQGLRKIAADTRDQWQEQRDSQTMLGGVQIQTSEPRVMFFVYEAAVTAAINLIGQEKEQIDLERESYKSTQGEFEGPRFTDHMEEILDESRRRIIAEFVRRDLNFLPDE